MYKCSLIRNYPKNKEKRHIYTDRINRIGMQYYNTVKASLRRLKGSSRRNKSRLCQCQSVNTAEKARLVQPAISVRAHCQWLSKPIHLVPPNYSLQSRYVAAPHTAKTRLGGLNLRQSGCVRRETNLIGSERGTNIACPPLYQLIKVGWAAVLTTRSNPLSGRTPSPLPVLLKQMETNLIHELLGSHRPCFLVLFHRLAQMSTILPQ